MFDISKIPLHQNQYKDDWSEVLVIETSDGRQREARVVRFWGTDAAQLMPRIPLDQIVNWKYKI